MATSTNEPTFIEALVKARSEMPTLVFDAANSHFKSKYLTLAGVMEGVSPVLSQNGIFATHSAFRAEDGSPWLRTTLVHVSGDRVESELPIAGSNPQQMGSAITYARRYAILGLLGLVGDEDDDGNSASGISTGPSDAQLNMIKSLMRTVRKATTKAASDKVSQELVGKNIDALDKEDTSKLIDLLKKEEANAGAF